MPAAVIVSSLVIVVVVTIVVVGFVVSLPTDTANCAIPRRSLNN